MGDQIVTGLSFASDLCRDRMGQVSWTNYRLKKSKTNAIRFFETQLKYALKMFLLNQFCDKFTVNCTSFIDKFIY